MKRSIILITVMWLSLAARSQDSEFTIHDNGLIYDATTMNSLEHIVDSLNLKFKTCEAKACRAFAQGYGSYFQLKSGTKQARELIRKNITPEEFAAAFPKAEQRKVWIVKTTYTDYNNRGRIEYASLPLRKSSQVKITLAAGTANDKSAGWIVSKDDDDLSALYLHDLSEMPIPPDYARLIQYVDCMIDTTAQIYRVDRADFEKELQPGSKITQFMEWAERYEGRPEMPEIEWDSPYAAEQYQKYYREHEQWNNKRLEALDIKMKNGHYYRSLLMEAAEEAIVEKAGNWALEFYVERYLSAEQALEMKRNRKPMGFCSQDQTPRLHAASICRLAAETAQWDIFLRAHLDIMNDRFDRQSDGSYAWAGRGTYLKELEELDINATDLLIGTCLRSVNVNDNHYFGNIGRIGRALSETSSPEALVTTLVTMMEDDKLDLFNRLLISYVFDNLIYNLPDGDAKAEYRRRLLAAAESLPDGIGGMFEGE